MDGIELEIVWSNLISIVSEQAKALQRIAFSPGGARGGRSRQRAVRPPGPHGGAGGDRHARPHQLAGGGRQAFVAAFPAETLVPGDVLITNDPWLSAGPFLRHHRRAAGVPQGQAGRLLRARPIHHTDIGGYGVGAGARDVHEEGLWIPMLKLYRAGQPRVLHEIIRRNVRTPDHVFGDLAAQVSSGRLACKRLSALIDRHGYDDIDRVADELIARSEQRRARPFAGSSPAPITAKAPSTCRAAR